MDDWRKGVAVLLATRGQALKRYAYLLCGNDAEADDLVQEALVNVLRRSRHGELHPHQRACIVLRFYEDLTIPQIALVLGCGEGSVKRYSSDALGR